MPKGELCFECQKYTPFYPQYYVHVYSTRRRKAHILIPMVAEAKVATSDRKNFPEIQYPTYRSPNKIAHESAEVIQHLDYISVSGLWSDNKLNYTCVVSRISTFYYGVHVRCDTKSKNSHLTPHEEISQPE